VGLSRQTLHAWLGRYEAEMAIQGVCGRNESIADRMAKN
jgi:hypothetical protein